MVRQLAYRKNRYRWSKDDPDPFVAKSSTQIAATIASKTTDFMLWSKNCWGIWLALGPLHLIDKESWVDGSGTTRYTEDDPPDHLEDEYQQLLKWYDWSQATYNSTSGVAWWDHTAIQGRFDTSVNAVQGALKADTSLEPQG